MIFNENRLTGGVAVKCFLKFLEYTDLNFQWLKLRKNVYTKYISLEITMMQFGDIRGRLINFFQNSSETSISDSIPWNCVKIFMLYTYFEV